MAEDSGFLDDLVEMLVGDQEANPLGDLSVQTDPNVADKRTMIEAWIENNIPRQDELAIPSEAFDHRQSSESLRDNFNRMTDTRAEMRGDDIILQNLLEQLEGGIATERKLFVEGHPEIGSFSIESADLRRFFQSLDSDEGGFVEQRDLGREFSGFEPGV